MLDNAVVRFGTALEAAMQEASNGTKDENFKKQRARLVFARWLELPDREVFKSPGAK